MSHNLENQANNVVAIVNFAIVSALYILLIYRNSDILALHCIILSFQVRNKFSNAISEEKI